MADWKKEFTHLVHRAEQHFDALARRVRPRPGRPNKLMIAPYRGYGTPERLYLKGRVLADKNVRPAGKRDSLWRNLSNMYRRMESDEVPFARVKARFQGIEQEISADEEGYFEFQIQPASLPPSLWHEIELELADPLPAELPAPKANGQVFVPGANAEYGVISDIDDTVVFTDAARWLHMARNIFLSNARTRRPFSGVPAFYQALASGSRGQAGNPIFFVSSSPWNLYDLLADFFQLNDIAQEPILLLRDWGITEEETLPTDHHTHKLQAIQQVLALYPALKFLLIGDSGQQDPEVYRAIVERSPGRVLGVYIRDVTHTPRRTAGIMEIARRVAGLGVPLVLAADTDAMASDAAERGWIGKSSDLACSVP